MHIGEIISKKFAYQWRYHRAPSRASDMSVRNSSAAETLRTKKTKCKAMDMPVALKMRGRRRRRRRNPYLCWRWPKRNHPEWSDCKTDPQSDENVRDIPTALELFSCPFAPRAPRQASDLSLSSLLSFSVKIYFSQNANPRAELETLSVCLSVCLWVSS